MLDLLPTLNRTAARALLADPDTHALAAIIALTCFIGDDFLDEDEQPLTPEELREMLAEDKVLVADGNLDKIAGLLFAVSGEEFLNDPTLFKRLVAAVNEGDPYAFEDDEDEPTMPEIFWAMYQLELLVEDQITEEIGERVQQYIGRLSDNEAEDIEELLAEESEVIEAYTDRLLRFHKLSLAAQLRALDCKAEWLDGLDPDLAELLRQA
jgi:hypothetical protein